MELSDAQYDRLITMLADNRVAVHTAKKQLSEEIQQVKKDLSKQIGFLSSQVDAVDADLTKVQKATREHAAVLDSVEKTQREHGGILKAMDQSLEGVTQLGKTTFDMVESINKRALGESSTIIHGDAQDSQRPAEQ